MTDTMPAVDAELAAEFEPPTLPERVMRMLVRGKGRRAIAAELGIRLVEVNVHVAQAVRDQAGERGTDREALAVIHASLDDIHERAMSTVDSSPITADGIAPLLAIVLEVHRLRLALMSKRAGS